jgi:hypothetical protein
MSLDGIGLDWKRWDGMGWKGKARDGSAIDPIISTRSDVTA